MYTVTDNPNKIETQRDTNTQRIFESEEKYNAAVGLSFEKHLCVYIKEKQHLNNKA